MTPRIHLYLFKVTEFCNLNCPYCYMFNLRDQAFRRKPKVMPLGLVEAAAPKMVRLAVEQGVEKLTVSLHGGEPLLAGREWFRSAIGILRRAAGDSVCIEFCTQTNGTLIDEAWLDFCEEMPVRIGLSMDGPPEIHDRNRPNFAGRGSYDAVARGLRLLQKRAIFTGVLCVMDPNSDGLEIYRHFRDLGVKRIDFLWPLDYNWDTLPPGFEDPAATPFADYLIPIFDEWWREDNREVEVRYFRQLLMNVFGARGGLDSLGGNPVTITSIDSDGSIEPVDSLKACGDGFTDMGVNVRTDPIVAIYDKPLFQAAIAGQAGLCAICRACPLHDVCGGGYLPHRYRRANLFDNPSVYCRDLWKLITHIISVASQQVEAVEHLSATPEIWREDAMLGQL
jgi:uncharacterized protein